MIWCGTVQSSWIIKGVWHQAPLMNKWVTHMVAFEQNTSQLLWIWYRISTFTNIFTDILWIYWDLKGWSQCHLPDHDIFCNETKFEIFQKETMEMKTVIAWAIAGVTFLILSIFALIVFLKRKTIFRCTNTTKLVFFHIWYIYCRRSGRLNMNSD